MPVDPPATAQVTAVHFVARNDLEQLTEIVELIDMGALTVGVTESHPLSDLALVHRKGEAGQTSTDSFAANLRLLHHVNSTTIATKTKNINLFVCKP
jgi:hypothetical protein